MIKSRTIFVVGAGASYEAGLPIGSKLAEIIGARLKLVGNDFQKKIRDPEIGEAFASEGNKARFLEAAKSISEAMPLAFSIDNFLHSHKSSSEIVEVGKLAIVKSILEAEKKSALYFDESNANNRLDATKLTGTWYIKLWHLLSTDVSLEEVDTIFDNVSFVIFNYDRCVEKFLYEALRSYYRLDENGAAEVMQKLKVFHPYGRVGSLLSTSEERVVPFGNTDRISALRSLARQVRTFTETSDNRQDFSDMYETIRFAEKMVFLGFAYHTLNMRLLSPERRCFAEHIFGTCLNSSDSDAGVFKERIEEVLFGAVDPLNHAAQLDQMSFHEKLKIRLFDGTCSKLFEEYSQSIGYTESSSVERWEVQRPKPTANTVDRSS